ncbi:MAG: ferritin-like domain-containing protein [Deltaproteobacteria bacterium]|nr:ferritin-like domain-containing protein [Nannocystaceae bacterium]
MKRAIFAAAGLSACGPSVGSDDDGDGEGGSSDASSIGDGSSSTSPGTTATASTTEPSTSSPSDSSTGELPWSCGAPLPPEVMPPACDDPQPLSQPGVDGSVPSGLERCADGVVHPVEAVACEYPPSVVGDCDLDDSTCLTDADCTEAPHGFCNAGGFKNPGCGCYYACETDAECGVGEACVCDGNRSSCVQADCSSDADCDGWPCVQGTDVSVCGPDRPYFACASPGDSCLGLDDDCDAAACEVCSWSPDECTWACRQDDDICSDCGRPYLVEGHARTASAVMRDDWSAEPVRGDLELGEHARAVVAAHWQRAALTEHASVAAFARYALDLMALAAPADLVSGAATAMTDEIEHARLCFALAARYGARACGPGPLASDGALAGRTPLRILDDVVREACIGETLAALEAIEALAEAREPAVRAALQRIADDELRHAQLGWRHLQWQLGRADARERAVILDLVDRAITDAGMVPIVGAASSDFRRFGVLDTETRARARIMGLVEVVAPCAVARIAAATPIARVAVA